MNKTFKIATPISHLFKETGFQDQIIKLSDFLELRDNDIWIDNAKISLYHSELNIIAKWELIDIEKLKKVKKKYEIKNISYHLASRYQKNRIVKNAYVGIDAPISIKEMNENIKDNINNTRNIFGENISILIENTNHLLTDAYELITNADFIYKIVQNHNLFFLLDIPHAKITAYNKEIEFFEYINNLPLDRCKQIHISSCSIKNKEAFDSHDEMQIEDWNLFKKILHLINSVEFISIEYYKSGEKLLNQLNTLRKIKSDL